MCLEIKLLLNHLVFCLWYDINNIRNCCFLLESHCQKYQKTLKWYWTMFFVLRYAWQQFAIYYHFFFFSHGNNIDMRRSLSYFMKMTTGTKNFHLEICQGCKYFGWSRLLNSICNLTRCNFYGNLRSLFQQNWRLKID